jgi:hypothetical protein
VKLEVSSYLHQPLTTINVHLIGGSYLPAFDNLGLSGVEKSRMWPDEEGTLPIRSVEKRLAVDKKACWGVPNASAVSTEVLVRIFDVYFEAFSADLHV